VIRVLFISLALIGSLVAGEARADRAHGVPARFVGQVTQLVGPPGNPTEFTLQLRYRSIDIKIASDAVFIARSAEAEVEGFQVGDYATVTARRAEHVWIAVRIQFDVQPLVTALVSVTGTVLRVSNDERRIVIRLDTGGTGTRLITIGVKTRFEIDGQPAPVAVPLVKGDIVHVQMRATNHGWYALTVDLVSTATPGLR
jgi:hypothetical protein